MTEAWGYFALGLVLLALGGDSIVKGASGLAQRVGASPFIAGLLLIAFGTSLPELAVNARAMWVGSQELALGNAVGSNIVNLGLTLGLAAVIAPVVVRMRLLSPVLVLLAIATLALIVFGLDGMVSRIEGMVLLLAFVAMVAFLLARARSEDAAVRAEIEAYASTRTDLWMNLLRFVVAAVLLYYGARFVVQGAPVIGAHWGLSPLLTGLLPVAIGTALPEIAAAAMAARRGQGDMVAGHVIGSSLFNLLVVVGGMAAFRPLPLPESFVRLELPAAIAFVIVLYPMLRGDLRISRREGAFLLIAFFGWLVLEIALLA
ncbi:MULTISPECIES: calcium/sodium antiporter [unclassified Pseudoxanthomonas]|uniref:calcium/sodium antiporter n=1 Tax=unclassified Pseudoxanthomonas TaxID=2645906 RepID=UPI0008DF552F|nr:MULTISPECIES: calcium/sodium antiporter [unclassified Pseudoxanthomonas]PPJ41483.1 calcium:sodium antiporter [Pseudoxanthomonas sp. KAs_5_3]SFV30179.1 cation:H+ antiporter [Pseudoxanthomonas sp. YR558]